jgi:glyoxylase-like metal-dependent hydrolase (beta-lactamase superfamily II)
MKTDTRRPEQVAPGIYRLGTEIVNWYLVEDGDRLTAVDTGLPGFLANLESDLEAVGHRVDDVDAVVLTHSDGDHTGLAAALREAGATVSIHADDEGTLRNPGPKSGDGSPVHLVGEMWRPSFWRFMGHMARRGGGHPPKLEGAETFSDGERLDVPGSPRVVHTPGHTPGHSALLFERHRVLFVGDALCTWNPLTGRRWPQLMPHSFNTSNDAGRESLGAIEGLDADVLLPGHGEPWREGAAAAVASARDTARR